MNIAINRKRLGHLAVWTLCASRQEMVTYAVAMTAIYTAIIWLMLWVARDESPADRELTMYLAQGFCTSAYCFGCFFFMTRAFAVLGTKGGATAFLSLPASMTEKWLVRVLYSFVALQLVATAALFLADGLGWLFSLSLGQEYPRGVALGVMEEVARGFRYSTTVGGETFRSPWLFGVSLNVFSSALVVWSSAGFRHPLLSSIGIMAALVVFLVAPGLRATQGLLQVLGGEWLTFLFYLSAVVMLFGAYWLLRLSYRALTRREIVTQKWMNL